MANLFAYRATQPRIMMLADDPIGPNNDQILFDLVSKVDIVVAAWGNHGSFMGRSAHIARSIHNLRANKVKFYDFSTKDIEKSVEVRKAVGAKRFKVVRMNQTSIYARFT